MMLAAIFGDKYSLWQIVENYWVISPVAFVVSLLATPIFHKLAMRLGIVDLPDATVKTHEKPTAYLGGVAILMGLLAGLLVGFWLLYYHRDDPLSYVIPEQAFSGRFPNWLMLAFVGFGAAIACLVGLLDDLLDLKPWQKLLGQTVAAVLLWAVGISPNLVHLASLFNLEISPIWNTFLEIPVILFFILGATNSLNLLDGLDGLCAGVTSIITLAYLALAVILATWGYSPVGDPVRLTLCLAMVGGVLGFLPMNRHPAKIFMGDAGSMLLGFIAGTLMLMFMEQFGRWSVGAIVIFGLPILDTAVAMVRRLINKCPIFLSDRGHIYDQFMDRGWPLRKAVKMCYLLAGLFALIGLITSQLRFRYALVTFIMVFAISALIVWQRGFLQIPEKKSPTDNNEPRA
jgi:UDP-GlcNAc:undecaprenyl-phosphate GlcNAc-1-phosphate transferase